LATQQKYVFKTSLIEKGKDYYTIGTYDAVAHKFTPDNPERDIGHGFLYDYGKYYASKTLYDPIKNRRVVWAWVNESDTEAMDIAKGWSSVLVRFVCPPHCFVIE
jgi:beta-fructofuranosidase